MSEEQILNLIEKRTNSSNKAHEEVIRDLQVSIKELHIMFADHSKKMEPMFEWFDRFTVGKSILMNAAKMIAWLGGAIVAIGGAYYVIQSVLKGIIK